MEAWDERDRQSEIGGFAALNSALALPMVLVMSIWADVSSKNSRPFPLPPYFPSLPQFQKLPKSDIP